MPSSLTEISTEESVDGWREGISSLRVRARAPELLSDIGLHVRESGWMPRFPSSGMQEKREPELIAPCKRGDKAAWTELFDRHYASSLRLAQGILRSAYLSALRHICNFRWDATF